MSVNVEAAIQDNPDPAKFQTLVKSLLGNATHVGSAKGFDLNMMQGSPHSTTTLPYEIYGSAKVVSQTVGTWLASFKDPIRAILGTGIHSQQKIIIKRKYVVGVAAQITPERAPARTVSIQEDVREVELDRYGGDIEMNLNQFLVPGAAEEELNMKVDAQKLELERTLCNLGYDMLMQQGTNLVDAIMRSSPAHLADSATAVDVARRIARTEVFGAMNKFEYPIINLLAACRYASAYSVGTQRGSVMLLPHGIPDILRYSTPQEMHYKLTGVKSGDKHKPLTMQLDDGYVDNATSVKILVKHPNPRYENGAAHPEVYTDLEGGAGGAGLVRKTYVASDHPVARSGATCAANMRVVDLQSGALVSPFAGAPEDDDTKDPSQGRASAVHMPTNIVGRLALVQALNAGPITQVNVQKWGFNMRNGDGMNGADAAGGKLAVATDQNELWQMGPITVAHVANEAGDPDDDMSVTTCIAPPEYVRHMQNVCGDNSWLSLAYEGRGFAGDESELAFTFLTRKGTVKGGSGGTAFGATEMVETQWASCLIAMGFYGMGNTWFNNRQLIAVKFHHRQTSAFARHRAGRHQANLGDDAAYVDGARSAWFFRDLEEAQVAGRDLAVVPGHAQSMACLFVAQPLEANPGDRCGLVFPTWPAADGYTYDIPTGLVLADAIADKDGNLDITKERISAVARCTEVITSSAILAAPGSATGELLVGFPFTSVSTSQADERMRIQLRCYLGAALYQPDNVIVLHDVYIEGVKKSEYVVLTRSGRLEAASKFSSKQIPHGAATTSMDQITTNTGEFGRFDDPEQYGGLHGPPQHFADHHHDSRHRVALPPVQLDNAQKASVKLAVDGCVNYIERATAGPTPDLNISDNEAMTKDDMAAAEDARDDDLLPLLAAYAFVTHMNSLSACARSVIEVIRTQPTGSTALRKADKLVAYFAHVDVHRGHETDITQNIAKITGCGRGAAFGTTWRDNTNGT